jgi:hypothetical protein
MKPEAGARGFEMESNCVLLSRGHATAIPAIILSHGQSAAPALSRDHQICG